MTIMKKIGFIDYYLDEWHANNYPGLIKAASNGELEVVCAYAQIDSPKGGRTTDQWCKEMGISRCERIEDVISRCDFLVVLSPDNPEMHRELCRLPLRSGKPVFVDKTFTNDAATARELFAVAKEYSTPMYSSSALRFSKELAPLKKCDIDFVQTIGAGTSENYLVHQAEPMIALVKSPVKQITCNETELSVHFDITFENGTKGCMTLFGWDGGAPFGITVKYKDGGMAFIPECTEFFERFITEMVGFFRNPANPPAPSEETIWVMELIEAAHKAQEKCRMS